MYYYIPVNNMNKNIDKSAIINHNIRTVARGRIDLHYNVFQSLVVCI